MNIHYCTSHNHTTQRKLILFLSLAIMSLLTLQGCSTLHGGHKWGQNATLTPGWDRIKKSMVDAASSPETWGPVAGAMILQIDDMDKRISDWASDHNPIFGSRNNADQWSDYLKHTSVAIYGATAIATPGEDDATEWITAKMKGLAVGLAAWGITRTSTSLIKSASERTRPDASDDLSFPSGHAAMTSSLATLSRRNLDSIPLSPGSRLLADAGIVGIAAGTSWARVEAAAHYPSDVLAGYALGHFLSAFINDAFLGVDSEKTPQLIVEPSREGIWIGLRLPF